MVKVNGRKTKLDKSFFSCECGRMGLGRESLAHVYREFRHAWIISVTGMTLIDSKLTSSKEKIKTYSTSLA